MGDVASRYISRGGRTAGYDRDAYTEDLMSVAGFLAWAEDDGAFYGMVDAGDAFKAMCRLLDVDSVRLRKVMKGEGLDDG